jgi:hypothetical protein
MASDRRSVRCIGSLDDDATSLASLIQLGLVNSSLLVWAEEDGRVYVGPSTEVAWVPPSWIAGLFVNGQTLIAIADDLRSLMAQRAAAGMFGT